jgi:hypothetical protein
MWSNAALAIAELDEDSRMNSQIEVRDSNGFKGVFAREDIVEDSAIFYLKGTVSKIPTRYTIQLGRNRHLNFPLVRWIDDDLDYCWQSLNHNCEPNGYMNVHDLTFRAAKNIRRGAEITFNYLTTESEMAVPFSCICGSENCFGFIRGRNFLSAEQSRRLSLAAGEDNVVTLFPPLVLAKPINLSLK